MKPLGALHIKRGLHEAPWVLSKAPRGFIHIYFTVYHLTTGPTELEQDNQSDAFTWYFYLSVDSIVQAWIPWEESILDWYRGVSKENKLIKESKRTILEEEYLSERMKEDSVITNTKWILNHDIIINLKRYNNSINYQYSKININSAWN